MGCDTGQLASSPLPIIPNLLGAEPEPNQPPSPLRRSRDALSHGWTQMHQRAVRLIPMRQSFFLPSTVLLSLKTVKSKQSPDTKVGFVSELHCACSEHSKNDRHKEAVYEQIQQTSRTSGKCLPILNWPFHQILNILISFITSWINDNSSRRRVAIQQVFFVFHFYRYWLCAST